MHLPPIIGDLALILIVSGVVAVIFRWLRQPTVLGYLIAGILVGPRVTLLPSVADPDNIKVWAELGVIFLLFHLGMEFSFKKLLTVGRPAAIAAIFEVSGMLLLGCGIGKMLGWSAMDALFLGAILSISSTAIIIKAFDELAVKTQLFATMAFGILIIEDLFAVLLLILLSTVAASRSLEGRLLVFKFVELAGFLLVILPLGLKVFPWVLRTLRSHLNDETRVIFALGLCLGLVFLCAKVGLSPAFGAFLMGSFMAETNEGERIERFMLPIKDWFGAIFFTSVGMLVDPAGILRHWPLVLLITAATVVGKIVTTSAGMFLARQDKRVALQTGLCLAQIGEFSFIIATLGLDLKVIRPDLYPLAVAVSLITTFITPYLIRFATSRTLSRLTQSEMEGLTVRNRMGSRFWDGHLVELEVHPHFLHVGKPLEELKLRERFGISIVSILRGSKRFLAPTRDQSLMSYDRVIVLGTDQQLAALEGFLRVERYELRALDEEPYELRQIRLSADSAWIGKTLRESGVREAINGLVLGIERLGQRRLNPDSTETFSEGDVVWLYGRKENLRSLPE